MRRDLPHHCRQSLARNFAERHPHSLPGDKFLARRRHIDIELQMKMREGVGHETGDKFPVRVERRVSERVIPAPASGARKSL